MSWALFLLGAGCIAAALLTFDSKLLVGGLVVLGAYHLLCRGAQNRGEAQLQGVISEAELVREKLNALESDLANYMSRLTGFERSLPGLMFEAHVSSAGKVSFPYFAGSLLAVLGYTVDEARRDPTLIFSRIHPADRERRDRLIRMSLSARASYADVCRLVAPNGTILWIRCRWCFDREASDGAVWTVLWTDITEQYENRQLAEAANRGKSEAVARISHDLRTPLNAIMGFTDLLLAENLSGKERKYAAAAGQAGQALLWLVDQLLTVQKAESQTSSASQVEYSLDQLIEQSVSLLEPAADRKGLTIEAVRAPDLPTHFKGDPERIKQVLVNLLSNAVKFSNEGVIRLWVTRLDHMPGEVALRFAVCDRGIGIAPEKLSKLFQPYIQASAATGWLFGGSGLGLAICRHVAESLGGKVGATSEPGSGSTFWFEVRQLSSEPPASQRPPPVRERGPEGSAASILVADDVRLNRELLAVILQQAGHEIRLAKDGAEAVQAAMERPYDLILMDIQMPGTDGLEATAAIRNSPGPNQHVPIVALSAGANDADIARSRSAGMDDHVTKPVKAADLLWTVGEWTRPLEEAGLPTLDEEWLDGLAARVGKDKVVEYLAEFVEEVALVLGRCGADDRIETGRLAHRLVGSAGQLGFKALSAASRQLMLACNEPDGTSLPTAAAQRNLRLALAEGQAIISQLSAAGDATGTFAA